jgi:Ni2+-binding GTPase involved in maturation of urease and hydrogenase
LLERNIQRLKPEVKVLRVSAMTGAGFEPWLAWLLEGARVPA